MNALPLYMKDAFGEPVGFVLATLLGFGFGFVLERSGFGRANVLSAQFYFTDTRVLKVMFSAIVTALLGTRRRLHGAAEDTRRACQVGTVGSRGRSVRELRRLHGRLQ